ncbi:hypothetical protein B0A52_01454 [Exophiala mesophila]|uniref:Heterokaryon incompatibility domain-containing protein n=1 Tax=Exophiala mesophila TaxID=212818 RepID=A0A438NF17_EXOME|nr:hypothetical protein B0A52_01454 [Exophiala mesophila]
MSWPRGISGLRDQCRKILEEPGRPKTEVVYGNAYFSRLWIIQEPALAEFATIHFGDESLSMCNFQKAMMLLGRMHGTIPDIVTNPLLYVKAWMMIQSKSARQADMAASNNPRFQRYNTAFRQFGKWLSYLPLHDCKLGHDRVFGLLGLAPPDCKIKIKPSYKIKVEQVYVQLAKEHLLCQETDILFGAGLWRRKWLGVTHEVHVPAKDDQTHLPSWTPEYRPENAQNQFVEWRQNCSVSQRPDPDYGDSGSPLYRALHAQPCFDPDNPHRLGIDGIKISNLDGLKEYTKLPVVGCTVQQVCEVVLELQQDYFDVIKDETESVRMTLVDQLPDLVLAGGCLLSENDEVWYKNLRKEAFVLFADKCLNQPDLAVFKDILLSANDAEDQVSRFETRIGEIKLDRYPGLKEGHFTIHGGVLRRPTYLSSNGQVEVSGDASLSSAGLDHAVGQTRSIVPILWRYVHRLASIFQVCSFFMNSQDIIRVAPTGARNGDTFAILDGCELPLLLRKSVETDPQLENYAIIGPCYAPYATDAAYLDKITNMYMSNYDIVPSRIWIV